MTRPKQVLGLGLKGQETDESSDPGLCICCRPTSRREPCPGPGALTLSEQDGGQHMIRNEISGTVYNYSLFHVTMCLANMYITMQLTQWFQPQVCVAFKRTYKVRNFNFDDDLQTYAAKAILRNLFYLL